MNRSRAFPIVLVVPGAGKEPARGRFDLFLMGMVDGQLFWTDDVHEALRFSSAGSASAVGNRITGAKIRVAFA